MNTLTPERSLSIHKALYNLKAIGMTLDNKLYNIDVASNNSRYLTWGKHTFIQEAASERTKLGRARLDGHQITRIMRPNRPWGLILNGNIEKE